jgi:8-oxo-dGTP diphosphatase
VSDVRAAGGIVSRLVDGRVEVLLVHRPAYDDWTLPKGKAEPGEPDEACALREVEEETGLRCRVTGEVGVTRYADPKGRAKVVRYFAMEPADGSSLLLEHEVDDTRWVELDRAAGELTYERDRELLAGYARARRLTDVR